MIAGTKETVRPIIGNISQRHNTPCDDAWKGITAKYKFLISYRGPGCTLSMLRVYRSNRDSLAMGHSLSQSNAHAFHKSARLNGTQIIIRGKQLP